MSAGLIVPVGQAYAGAKMLGLTGRAVYGAVGKTFVKELSYDIAGDVIGSGTSGFVFDLTGNVNLSRLAGLSAGMMTSGKTLNHVDNVTSSTVKGLNHADNFTSTSKKFDRFADASKAVDKMQAGEEGIRITKSYTAEEVNKIFKDSLGYEPPYKPGTNVIEIKLTERKTYVRVYDKVNSRMQGGWIMELDDIAGLSPAEIQNKYSLPHIPKYICDVELEAGTYLRKGEVNPLFKSKGGGTQFDLMVNGKNVGKFTNERKIEN